MALNDAKRLFVRYWRNEVPEKQRLCIEKMFRFGVGSNYIQCSDFLFVHVPKCAGSSLSVALYGKKVPHFTLQCYKIIFYYHFITAYKFAFVRDPVDRLISCYKFLKTYGTREVSVHRGRKYSFLSNLSFDEFVSYLCEVDIYDEDIVLLPQAEFLFDESDNLLCDEIFYYERISDEVLRLEQKLAVSIPLKMTNKSEDGGVVKVSDCSRRLIKNLYARDYHLLGY